MIQIALRMAVRLSAKSDHGFAHHAVIVERGGAIVSFGYNHHERHAEVVALSRLWPSKREGTRVYSLRVRKDGSFAAGKPCEKCMAYLKKNKVREVCYSDSTGNMIWERIC